MTNQQFDTIEQFSGATIQHGKMNERIYLMKLNDADPKKLIVELDRLAQIQKYTKIFAKIPVNKADYFYEHGYTKEGEIPRFFSGSTDAVFAGKFIDLQRKTASNQDELDNVLELAKSKQTSQPELRPLADDTVIRVCMPDDASRMSELYKEVFPTYPFPIHDPEYLCDTMATHIMYFCVEVNGVIVALSSAEMDRKNGNCEMTDFATLPKWRGNQFALHLLYRMEQEVPSQGIQTVYTIARAVSPGMNIVFAKSGYQFGGCLINNTNISGTIESMNIWYKPL